MKHSVIAGNVFQQVKFKDVLKDTLSETKIDNVSLCNAKTKLDIKNERQDFEICRSVLHTY